MSQPITAPSSITDRAAHTASALSALVDDALTVADTRRALQGLTHDPQAQQRWSRYCLISDVMQGHVPVAIDAHFATRLQQAIAQEPPLRVPYQPWQRLRSTPLMRWSMAASVVLTGYLLFQHDVPPHATASHTAVIADTPSAAPALSHSISPPDAPNTVTTPTVLVTHNAPYADRTTDPYIEAHLNSYLVNHSGRTSTNHLQGMLPYVRLVGYQSDPSYPSDFER